MSITQAPAALTAALVLLLSAWSPAQSAPVNINTADAALIAEGPKGIGLKRAQAIVEYRQKHGPFRNADELALVKGIGTKVIQKNRADIRTSAVPAAAGATPRAAAAAPAAPKSMSR